MPKSGTHITVVEQLALQARDNQLRLLLGSPTAPPDSPEGKKMRFAKLGAVGPDLFYMLGDYNIPGAPALQDLENFLVKVAGTFACLKELSEEVNDWIDSKVDQFTLGIATELERSSDLISEIKKEILMALSVYNINLWSQFRSPRQKDCPIRQWFWADSLHYQCTGDFTKQLLLNAKASGNENLYAYALGYLTHYVTDVVGHPYVNQVVQGPYRLHWQRHMLVENYIDAYVWDRWHRRSADSTDDEGNLDIAVHSAHHGIGFGTPITTAHLHEHIAVGNTSLGDPLDSIVEAVCTKIKEGLFDIGILEEIEIEPPDDPDFTQWCDFVIQTMIQVYKDKEHPRILEGQPDPRPEGFPTAEDLAGAYGVLRLLLKISTEEDIEAPVFPDFAGDVSDVIERTMQNVMNDIGGIPPFPSNDSNDPISIEALIQAIVDAVQWESEVVVGVGKALVDLMVGAAQAGVVIAADVIKAHLWLLNSALYSMYRYFRQFLVLNAYMIPLTDELQAQLYAFNTSELWTSKGNLGRDSYPVEEDPRARHLSSIEYPIELVTLGRFRPHIPPARNLTVVENPSVGFAAPYRSGDKPEAFLEGPLGPDNMFSDDALQTALALEKTFADTKKHFGGAIQNSKKAILDFDTTGDINLPNFDLDGDRGYAWPGWLSETPLDPYRDFGLQREIEVHARPICD